MFRMRTYVRFECTSEILSSRPWRGDKIQAAVIASLSDLSIEQRISGGKSKNEMQK